VGSGSGSHLNKYLTLFGIDSRYQGSFKILSVTNSGVSRALLDTATDFSAFATNPADAYWVITDAPVSAPVATALGTELVGLRPVRIYRKAAISYPVASVNTDLSVSEITLKDPVTLAAASLTGGIKQPYRITRPNTRRITSTDMSLNPLGQFFYFDTLVESLGNDPKNNIAENVYLEMLESSYTSLGYKISSDDETKTFSMQDGGTFTSSLKVLPVGLTDRGDNYKSVLGVPVQISYETAPVVEDVQNFLNSRIDRDASANFLAKHFLPCYVSYDATYIGGSSTAVIAPEIKDYIVNLALEQPIDVSELQKVIDFRGGNVVTPTLASIVIHGWDRKILAEISSDELGGTKTKVPFGGTLRLLGYLSGEDVSNQDPIPAGERINLIRL
jgi:hypothetical protein